VESPYTPKITYNLSLHINLFKKSLHCMYLFMDFTCVLITVKRPPYLIRKTKTNYLDDEYPPFFPNLSLLKNEHLVLLMKARKA